MQKDINLLLKQVTDRKSPILINDLQIEPVYSDEKDYIFNRQKKDMNIILNHKQQL